MASIAWQIVACLLVADFLTGLFHWAEETYGLPTWPIFGPSVIGPNIEHHYHPAKICDGTLVSRNWQMWLAAAIAVGLAWCCGALTWQLALVAAAASFGNEVHSWSHGKAPRAARLLQEMGVLVTPRQHGKHHRPPFDRAFCTMTCWLNPVLDAARFWRGLESVIALAGVAPKRGSPERGGV